MDWHNASKVKPTGYETVLVCLTDGMYTTGYWADKAIPEATWICFAFNQSPPIYGLPEYEVFLWCKIETPKGVTSVDNSVIP